MRLAMSNIAWDPEQAREAYALLARHGVTGLEIAPGLAFAGAADPVAPDAAALARFAAERAEFGLELVSMQSLLFAVEGAQLFGTPDERAAFAHAMERAIALAGRIGVPNLVFGSPRQRSHPATMPAAEARAQAGETFRRLGDRAAAAGAVIAIEPNPAVYGTNFLNTLAETAEFVAAVDHPAITLNFDIGALIAGGEAGAVAAIWHAAQGKVSHVHISEPALAPAPDDPALLARVAASLIELGYAGWFSIEMRQPPGDALAEADARLRLAISALAPLMRSGHAQ